MTENEDTTFAGLKFLIQYRDKENGIHWHNMAAYDVVLAAERYFEKLKLSESENLPWEYRLVDLENGTTTRQLSTDNKGDPSVISDC